MGVGVGWVGGWWGREEHATYAPVPHKNACMMDRSQDRQHTRKHASTDGP